MATVNEKKVGRFTAMEQLNAFTRSMNMIAQPDKWPAWPYLPLKRYDHWKDGNLGFIAESVIGAKIEPVVYLGNIFAPTFDKKVVYTDFQQMLNDGWLVD